MIPAAAVLPATHETTLRPADRCDRCSAGALVRVAKDGLDLDFCGHHFRVFEPRLGGWAVEVDDRPRRASST